MDVEVKILGYAELEARLQELGGLGSRRIMTKILRWVAQPLEDRAKRNAYGISKRGSSGALSRSVQIVGRRPLGIQVARVSVTSKSKDKTALFLHNSFYERARKGIFYGWMVERGHRTRGQKGGHVAGSPWFQPAVAATQSRMESDFLKYLTVAVRRAEKRKSKTADPDALVS